MKKLKLRGVKKFLGIEIKRWLGEIYVDGTEVIIDVKNHRLKEALTKEIQDALKRNDLFIPDVKYEYYPDGKIKKIADLMLLQKPGDLNFLRAVQGLISEYDEKYAGYKFYFWLSKIVEE